MDDYKKVIDKFFDKVVKELDVLNNKDTLSREEIKAGKEALCALHMVKHFEDDGMKYGWDEDSEIGYSQRGWAINEIPTRMPYSYADRSMNRSNRAYPMGINGNSYNDGYSRHGDIDDMTNMLSGLNERDRASAMEYINRLRGRG